MCEAVTCGAGGAVTVLDGVDLTVQRYFQSPIDDVWASVTSSERTALWFGPWSGDGRPGGRVVVTMTAEDGEPTAHLEVLACEPPHRLELAISVPPALSTQTCRRCPVMLLTGRNQQSLPAQPPERG